MNINHLKNKNIHFIECENWCDLYGYEKSEMKEDTINYIEQLQKENKILRENAKHNSKVVDKVNWENMLLKKENKQLKDKLSKIETLIINHNRNIGDIYYKYNSKILKSELEQRKYIKRLLDELDSADNYLKKVYLENYKKIMGLKK